MTTTPDAPAVACVNVHPELLGWLGPSMALGERFPEVLAAAQQGAPWALEALYREYHPAVLGFMRSKAPAEADDLASEVFLAAAAALPRFEGEEDGFRSWLFTIAYRTEVELQ